MWIFTNIGFFSVVEKADDAATGTVTIRARVRADLERLRHRYLPSLGPIAPSPSADYQFRAKASREAWALAMAKAAADVDYANFKSEVAKAQGPKRAHVYGEVWGAASGLAALDETYAAPKSSAVSFGGVVVDRDGRVLLRRPRGGFDGYAWTFAKAPAKGSSAEKTALAAVHRKTGYLAEIVRRIPGAYAGGASVSEFFVMRPVGEPLPFDPKSTEGIIWASPAKAEALIRQTSNPKGRTRDLAVLKAALATL